MKHIMALAAVSLALAATVLAKDRPRARDIGIAPGILAPGELNATTDVKGVRIGHATVRQGKRFNTGVTVINPADGNLYEHKLPAAVHVANGYGDYVIAFSTADSVRR